MAQLFDFGPMFDANIARFTAGFVTVNVGDPRPLGSGTLVKSKATQGILTCAHVLHELRKHTEIGILLFPIDPKKRQQMRILVTLLTGAAVELSDVPFSADGRDLAYLPLPPTLMSELTALASVIDLDLQAARAKLPKPEGTESAEVVAGVVNVLTPPAADLGQTIVLSAEGLMNVGKVVDVRTSKGFDLLEFEPIPEPGIKLPSTYGATSGGGMWRLLVRKEPDSTYSLVESRLVGVVFWQTAGPDRKLIGHGPISIYGHLLAELHLRWQ
jgi:hypothetical protein